LKPAEEGRIRDLKTSLQWGGVNTKKGKEVEEGETDKKEKKRNEGK